MKRSPPLLPTVSRGPERQPPQHAYPATPTTRESESKTSRPAETSRVVLITELEIPTRATQALARHGIRSVGVLITWSRAELAKEVIGLGEKSLDALEEVLTGQGLAFAREEPRSTQQVQTPLTNSRHINNHNVWIASI